MTDAQLTNLIEVEIDKIQTSYNNYKNSFLKDGMTPLTLVEWVRVQREAVNYEIEAA